jgi:hypothetical protein
MSEAKGPDFYAKDLAGFDEVFGFDVEMIPVQENIDAIIAWSKAKAKSIDPKSVEQSDAGAKKRDDPNRPAA